MPVNYPGMYGGQTNLPKVRTGTTWDINQGNIFGQNYRKPPTVTGSSFNPAQTTPMTAGGGLIGGGNTPAMGSSYTPAQPNAQTNPPMVAGGGLIGGGNTPATGSSYTPPPPPMPEMGQPNYGPGYQPGAFQTQYGTLGNIQDYMNPYLDQIIEKGNKNILASASARGLLGSTGTENQLGEWATQAQADAYNDAWGRFNTDRGYMTDVYRDGRNFDYGNFRDTDIWNYGLFTDERNDWNTRMGDWYNAMNGISNTGMNATGDAAGVYGDVFKALAQLYGNRGDVGAMQAMQDGNNNNGLISDFLGLLGLGG
jgi:hypothetical protein